MTAVLHPTGLQLLIAVVAIALWSVGALLAARGTGTAIVTADREQSTDPDFPTPVPASDRRPLDVRL